MSEVEIDDRDPSIVWTGFWVRTGSPSEHDNTVSGSRGTGNTALVTFTGTSITVYGTIPKATTNISSISQYTLDNGPVAGKFTPPPSPNVLYQQPFFTSQELPYGTHQLHIVDMITSDGLWLDYFVVATGLNPTNVTALPPAQNFPPPTDTARPSSGTHSDSLIIGLSVAVGGCAILAALFLAFYFVRRLRRSQPKLRAAIISEPIPAQKSFQGRAVVVETGYDFSGMHKKVESNVVPASSSPSTYNLSATSDGVSQITAFAAQPPLYMENRLL